MQDIVKCKNLIEKNGNQRVCDRFLLKRINNKQLHVKCPSCGSFAIITADNEGKLQIIHVKEGENIICN